MRQQGRRKRLLVVAAASPFLSAVLAAEQTSACHPFDPPDGFSTKAEGPVRAFTAPEGGFQAEPQDYVRETFAGRGCAGSSRPARRTRASGRATRRAHCNCRCSTSRAPAPASRGRTWSGSASARLAYRFRPG